MQSNETLLEKMTGDKDFKKTSTFIPISHKHLLVTISSLLIKQDEWKSTVLAIAKHTQQLSGKEIAINTDLNSRHLFKFKHHLQQAFNNTQISITLYINQ